MRIQVNVDSNFASFLRQSIYAVHIRRWLALFPLSQLHVVHGERFIRKPWHELAKIEHFLKLPSEIREDQVIDVE